MNRIIVLGTGYSGSGAVLAYLRGRPDIVDPFRGKEVQISQMPHGLMALHAACATAFHGPSAHEQIECFIRQTDAYARRSNWLWFGKNYDELIPDFKKKRDRFVSDILACRYPIHYEYLRLRTPKFWQVIEAAMRHFGFGNHKQFRRRWASLPVCEPEFLEAARCFTDALLEDWECEDDKAIVLNQAGSGWNPVSSTQYFRRRKVIVVLRDPRDQFLELKKFKGFDDVRAFSHWYQNMMARLDDVNDDSDVIIKIQFEKFVVDHDSSVETICRHIGCDSAVISTYIAAKSAGNIGQFRELKNEERAWIEKTCANWITAS
jgi:hypothetical protein